jgi:ferrous iron transport protein B
VSETEAEAHGVNEAVFGAMQERFDGQVGAFAYLLFVLLYFPCVATIGAIRREAGAAWAGFVAAWTTGVAYLTATLFYQVATFNQHPEVAATWIGGLLALFTLSVLSLRIWARRVASTGEAAPGAT